MRRGGGITDTWLFEFALPSGKAGMTAMTYGKKGHRLYVSFDDGTAIREFEELTGVKCEVFSFFSIWDAWSRVPGRIGGSFHSRAYFGGNLFAAVGMDAYGSTMISQSQGDGRWFSRSYSSSGARVFWGLILVGMAVAAGVLAGVGRAGEFDRDFAVVFVDEESEARLGKVPLSRHYFADALHILARAQARGVVIKFFLDRPSVASADARLAEALALVPCALQARIDPAEAKPNVLPEHAFHPGPLSAATISGKSGWIPLPEFSAAAKQIGFADVVMGSTNTPLFEIYGGRNVKSLVLSSMELATGTSAKLEEGHRVRLGDRTLTMNAREEVPLRLPAADDLTYTPLHVLLDGKVPPERFKDKVVILAYDGPGIHSFDTAIGKVKAHRLFIYSLKSAYGDLK